MPRRDKPAAAPPGRHRGARQTERHGGGRDPAELGDDIIRPRNTAHADTPTPETRAVHAEVTRSASARQDASRVNQPERVGDQLRALRIRAGLSAPALARAAGMPPTSYKSYEDRFAKPHLPVELATRLAPHLAGRGRPPITHEEVMNLAAAVAIFTESQYTERPTPNASRASHALLASPVARDVPVLATRSLGWARMAMNFQADPIDWLPRPAALASNRAVWAIAMSDASMSPRFDPGERLYCDPSRPPALGGYAVVILRAPEGAEAEAHVGRLVAQDDQQIRLATLNPAAERSIAARDIATIARVLTLAELLGG